MLPFSVDRLTAQQIQVGPEGVLVPPVNIHPSLKQYENYIAAHVVNTVSSRAGQNPARLFMFNMMSSNGWNNNFYAELYAFVAKFIAIGLAERRYNNIQEAIQMGAEEGCTVYISRLVSEYTDLKNYLDFSMMNVVMTNSSVYANTVNYNFNNQMSMGNNMGNFGNQRMGGSNMQMGQNYQAGLGQGTGFNRGNQQQTQMQQNTGDQNGLQRNYRSSPLNFGAVAKEVVNSGMPIFDKMPEPEEHIFTRDDWKPSAKNPYRKMVDERIFDRLYVQDGEDIIEVYERKEGTENMDRKRHTIHFLGNTYSLDSVLRRPALDKSAQALAAITPEDILAATSEGAEPEHAAEISTQVHLTPLVDTYLQSLIFEGRKRQLTFQNNSENRGIFRCCGSVFTPIATKESYRILLSVLAESKSFFQLSERMMKNGKSLTIEAQSDPEKIVETDDMAIFLTNVDRILTQHVNSFLKNELSLSISISSFTEDINDVRTYLENNYGQRYARAFDAYQSEMIGNFFVDPTTDIEDQLQSILDVNDGIPVLSYIPVNYSLTYVEGIPEDLEIHLDDNETLMITEVTSPILFNVAKSLFEQRDTLGIRPHYDLLITQDNQVFKLYKGAMSEGCYLISKG